MADDSSDDEGPTPNKIPRVSKSKDQQKRLIVILERASLETVKVIIILDVNVVKGDLQMTYFLFCFTH